MVRFPLCKAWRRPPDLPFISGETHKDKQSPFPIGVLRKRNKNHVTIQATIDNDLQANIITRRATAIIEREIEPADESNSRIICNARGTQYRSEGWIKIRYFQTGSSKSHEGTFHVVEDAPCDMIFGVEDDIAKISRPNSNAALPVGLRPQNKGTKANPFPFPSLSLLFFFSPLSSPPSLPPMPSM